MSETAQVARTAKGPVTDPRAHELRERYLALFGGREIPVDVHSIAEDLLGLSVAETALDGVSGLLFPAYRRIVVNAEEPHARQRFTLAHELGHWICQCLQREDAPPVLCRAEEVTPTPAARKLEREANVFAAELLMPEPAVRDEWRRAADLDELARRFGVSEQAMHWRLYSFGVVGERPETSLPR